MGSIGMVMTVPGAPTSTIETSLGTFRAHFSEAGLERLLLPAEQTGRLGPWPPADRADADPRLQFLAEELQAYAAGTLRRFKTPTAPRGTEFQLRVWSFLESIPYGSVTTYGEIARRLGAVPRAVGAANGANPVPILVPCHRVIGSDGSLTGYGGGLALKRRLLDLEGYDLVFG